MFKCRACEAKEKEIDHLRAIIAELQKQLEKATARVMELAQPGIERRMQTPPPEMPRPEQGDSWRYMDNPRYLMPGEERRPLQPRTVVDEEP